MPVHHRDVPGRLPELLPVLQDLGRGRLLLWLAQIPQTYGRVPRPGPTLWSLGSAHWLRSVLACSWILGWELEQPMLRCYRPSAGRPEPCHARSGLR